VPHHRIVAVVEARMASSRLPGKVMLPLGGRPAIGQLSRRLRAVAAIREIVVATTANATDDVLARYCEASGMKVYRGSEDDVLGRVSEAAASVGADWVAKVTADCPALDPEIVAGVIDRALASGADLTSNGIVRSYPDGMDCSVVRSDALYVAASEAADPLEREHTSLFLMRRPDRFKCEKVEAPSNLFWPELGLTLDTPEDYLLLTEVFDRLERSTPFSCEEVVSLLRERPDLVALNCNVRRKGES
jgi:spore coat polysaccharide biosynthesis protein SpsF